MGKAQLPTGRDKSIARASNRFMMFFALMFLVATDSVAIVRGYLLGLQAFNSAKMNEFLADPADSGEGER